MGHFRIITSSCSSSRVIGVTKSPHQGSPYVCFLLKGDIAPPILNTCPMNELHTAMRPACPGKFPYRPPRQGPGAAPTFRLTAYFLSLVTTKRGLEPQILP